MAMEKVVPVSGWDYGQPAVVLIPISSRGLIGFDRSEFVKRASHTFLPFIDSIKIAKDEQPVHIIALGAYEKYGCNRNGDAFKEAACRKYHDTFVKFARWYRNHKNTDPTQSYGVIKQSAYNEPMARVELLACLNREKSAAERNGGLVADKEMQKLASDPHASLPVSMACRIPFDQCLYCGNKARTRNEYCKEATCKVGGCKDNLTKLVKIGRDVFHVGVDNPNPTWFDISLVHKPADRIAYAGSADYMLKSASDDEGFFGIGGAKTAEDLGVTSPFGIVLQQEVYLGSYPRVVEEQVKLAYGLAQMEANMTPFGGDTLRAFAYHPHADWSFLGTPRTKESCEGLGALAQEKIIIPIEEFGRWTKRAEHVGDARNQLPGIYGRMISSGVMSENVTNNTFAPVPCTSMMQKRAAFRLKEAFSLSHDIVTSRVRHSIIRRHETPTVKIDFEKKASANNREASSLARDYAVYKLAALHAIAAFDNDLLLTARLAVSQNQV